MDKDTRLIFEAYSGSNGVIPNGTRVIFDLQNVMPEEFGLRGQELNAELLKQYNGKQAVVEACAIADEGEEPSYDNEYYDISFDNGFSLKAVSGYHLTPIPAASQKKAQPGSSDTRRF